MSKEQISYEVMTSEDPESGDLLLPIPQELLDKMGWKEGDILNWDSDEQGRWVLTKVS